jgi:8-oxo-dGTP diphosphatase
MTQHHKITVQALVIKDDRILLLKRKNTSFRSGFYGLPGGKLTVDETPLDGIIRELYEELGCLFEKNRIHLSSTMHVYYPQSVGNIIYFNFVLHVDNHVIINNEPDKCEHMDFFEYELLPQNTIEATRRAIDAHLNDVRYFEFVD